MILDFKRGSISHILCLDLTCGICMLQTMLVLIFLPGDWLVTSPGSIPRLSPTVCWQRLQLTCIPNEANRYRKWKHLKQQAHFHDMSEILANEWPLPCCSEHFMLRWKEICTSINVTFHHLFIYRPDPTTVVIRHLKVHVFKRANRSSVNYFQSRVLVTIQQVLHIFMTDSCCQRPPWRRIVRGEGGGGCDVGP